MKIVERSVEILTKTSYEDMIKLVEDAGRNCYQSYNKMSEGSAEKLIRQFVKVNHGSPLEFADIAVRICGDRSLMGQITRHRLASFCIESARYNNYASDKFGREISVIQPADIERNTSAFELWYRGCAESEFYYKELINKGVKPETARSVLPMSLATHIVMKANVREWRHIFKLRLDKRAQKDIRNVMLECLKKMGDKYPVFFEDIYADYCKSDAV